MSKINPVFTNYLYQGKPSHLKFIDRVSSLSVFPLCGKKVKLLQEEGDTDFTSYSVKSYKKENKVKAIAILIGLSFLLPVLLAIKAFSKENKRIANKVAKLKQADASVTETSNKVSKQSDKVGSKKERVSSEESKEEKKGSQVKSKEKEPSAPTDQKEDEKKVAAEEAGWGWNPFSYLTGSPSSKPLHEKDFVQVDPLESPKKTTETNS